MPQASIADAGGRTKVNLDMVARRRIVDHVHTLVPSIASRYMPMLYAWDGISYPPKPRRSLTTVHGDRGPGAEVDAVAVMQGYLIPDRYLDAVDERAVGRTWIEHRPAVIWRRDQDRV